MKAPKLYLHLQTLSPKSIKRFAAFVHSPYFSRHAETIALFDVLITHYPDFDLRDEVLFAAAFPGKKYNNARLRVLRTYVLDLLHKFWVQCEIEADPDLVTELLIRALGRQGLHEDQRKSVLKAQEQFSQQPIGSLGQAHHAYTLAEARVDATSRLDNRMVESTLQDALTHLDRYAMATRLKILCAVCNVNTQEVSEADANGFRQTVALCDQLDLQNDPLVGAYYHLLHLLVQAPHEKHYPALRAIIQDHQNCIAEDELVNIFGFLINHCLDSSNRGQPEFLPIAFELYQEMVALDLLFGKGGFSAHNYKNILSIGARLKEFEWTRKFLEETYTRIPERWREGVFHFGHAYLDFAAGNYSVAKRHLLKVEFFDLLYRSSHQILLLRIYFETVETEPFFNLAETFRRYLNRNNDLARNTKTSLLNFLSLTKKIFELKIGLRPSDSREALQEEIMSTTLLVDRNWVLEKLKSA